MSTTATLELVTPPSPAPELAAAIKETELAAPAAQTVLDAYTPFFTKAKDLVSKARLFIAEPPTDSVMQAKMARILRLAIKDERVGAEKTRKKLKEDALRYGRAVDGVNSVMLLLTEPIEEQLEAIEKAQEIAAAKAREALKAKRIELLNPYGVDVQFYQLDTMPEDSFARLLADTKTAHEAKIAAAAKAEADRIEAARVAEEARVAKEKADAEERERIEAENARLKKEKEAAEAAAKVEREKAAEAARVAEEAARVERERVAAEKAEAEKKRLAELAEIERLAQVERDRVAKEKANAEAKAAAELAAEKARLKAEADAAAEVARKEREAIEAKAAADKAEADRLAKIEREKREALEKAEATRVANEKKRQDEEAREAARAAAAPDKEKLLTFASLVETLEVPEFDTFSGKAVGDTITERIAELANLIRAKAAHL